MNESRKISALVSVCRYGKEVLCSVKIVHLIVRLTIVYALLSVPYWLLMASDRYVSEASIIIQRTDQVNAPGLDVSSIIAGVNGPNRGEQLLMREYLLSVDLLQRIDASLDLRSHYSDWRRDVISRMWFKNAPIEWFYRYWLARVDVDYDDYSGVLHIRLQAYDPVTARAIVNLMLKDGESHMNKIGHELAQAQVDFLDGQVKFAHDRLLDASHDLIDFQNRNGLMAPLATAENLNAIIAKLEAQKADIAIQLAAMPSALSPNQPTVMMLKKSLQALEQQIALKRAELASPTSKTLNYAVEEFQRLQMQVAFMQDVYKTALSALEKGRMDAARTLKKVSTLQEPTQPNYPLEPLRIYNVVVTLIVAGALIGFVKLLESIVLDHVD